MFNALIEVEEENLNQDYYDDKLQLQYNTEIKMEGLNFLSLINNNDISTCFFDPQYRGILDKMNYGNEGVSRGKSRSSLIQMGEKQIKEFIKEINRVIKPSGHLFLWIDKFHLCNGIKDWFESTSFEIVDFITWNKEKWEWAIGQDDFVSI